MGNCKDKIEYSCGKKVNARCVDYEGNLSECTDLGDCPSQNLHNVLEDMNRQLTEHCNNLNLDNSDVDCLYTPGVRPTDLTLPELLTSMSTMICQIRDSLPSDGDCNSVYTDPIDCANLDYKCLLDECGDSAAPQNLTELLQLMINQICNNVTVP